MLPRQVARLAAPYYYVNADRLNTAYDFVSGYFDKMVGWGPVQQLGGLAAGIQDYIRGLKTGAD
ncbi:MAG: hypothetical protein PQJ28_04525 [Spirochaetales bacterium]|nr:hypothetical protein [Spirochaetales bacterium]